MYSHLKGKKLLIVGSDVSNIDIINTAHEMGVQAVVVDGITDYSKAPSKRVADEAWDIDYSNVEEIVQKCKESNIDGVFAGYSEFRVLAACRIANRLGLPFYATEEQINITRNKRTFKDWCVKYDIPIPKDYCFSYPMSDEDKDCIEYPVIVKPADYAGRKGISVCNNRAELDVAVEYAAKMSVSKTVIVEQYLDGVEFSSIYTLKDGEISLSSINEKFITDDQEIKSGLCDFLISPAFSSKRYEEELDGKMRNFLRGIGAKNGVAFFQGMVTNDKIYVFEMGYRINGNNDYRVVDKFNHINFMKMMIAYSLCGSMCDDLSKDNPYYPEFCCTLLYYAHAGIVGKYEYQGLYNDSRISDIYSRVWLGKEIKEDGSTGQRIISMRITAKTLEELVEVVNFATSQIVCKDVNGKNMMFTPFDPEKLLR